MRDALASLGEPNGRRNHLLQLGARVYPGHTGSPLDLPAKALKAGDLAEYQRKIADLTRLAAELRHISEQCLGGTVAECRILEALSPPAAKADSG